MDIIAFPKMAVLCSAAAVATLCFSAAPAAAQDTAWQVNCLEDRVCELKSEIFQGEIVAARLSIFHVRGYFFLQYTIPLGVDLGKGISFAVDDNPQQPTVLSNCSGAGCTGTIELETDDIQKMIAGEAARIFFTSPANLDVFAISFALAGFTAAFDELTAR